MLMSHPHFSLAIVDSNMLAAIGMQQILADIMPIAEVRVFASFEQLETLQDTPFVHYFVSSRIFFEHAAFFREPSRRVIVLVNGDLQIAGVPTLNVCQEETALVRSILELHQRGHGAHGGMPHHHGAMSPHYHSSDSVPPHVAVDPPASRQELSAREVEVAILLAQGYINKEVADRLNISTTTVITHRTHIMEKLRARSLADIIIYVVMNGLLDVGEI